MMKNKRKIIIIVILSILLTFFLTKKISKQITKSVVNAVYTLVEKENDIALKKAFVSKKLFMANEDILKIIKNQNDEIIEASFDIQKSEEIMNNITKQMSDSIQNITDNGYILYIPVGSIFDEPILNNLGPRIPVKIDLTDIAMGSIRTEIREYGINNALVELYIDVEVKIAPVLLSKAKPKIKKYSFLASSKIISGSVPEYYGGKINKESSLFNLPVAKNI